MAHSSEKELLDLHLEFEQIRALERVIEKKAGVFYWGAIPFLHFHTQEGERLADVKTKSGWLRVEIPFNASLTARKQFLVKVKKAYQELSEKKKK